MPGGGGGGQSWSEHAAEVELACLLREYQSTRDRLVTASAQRTKDMLQRKLDTLQNRLTVKHGRVFVYYPRRHGPVIERRLTSSSSVKALQLRGFSRMPFGPDMTMGDLISLWSRREQLDPRFRYLLERAMTVKVRVRLDAHGFDLGD